MPIDSVWPLILSSSVLSAGLTQGFAVWREHYREKKDAPFSALYLAHALEQFADFCSTCLAEIEVYEGSSGHQGADYSSMPTLPDYPSEIDWTRLGKNIFEQAFEFRVSLSETTNNIHLAYYYDPPDGGDRELREGLVEQGLAALHLAALTRKEHKLNKRREGAEFSTRMHLTGLQTRLADNRRAAALADARALQTPQDLYTPSPDDTDEF